MKTFKNIIKSVYLSVKILFLSSLLYILIYKSILLKHSEIFSGAAICGEIVYNLSLAILASTIFYFIIIHIKDFYDKKDVFKIIKNRLTRFVNIRNRIKLEILNKNGCSPEDGNLSEEFIEKLFSNIAPNDISPIVIYPTRGKHIWLDFLILFTNKTLDLIQDTYRFLPYLDPVLLNLLYKVETSNYIINTKSFDGTPNYEWPDLSTFGKAFYYYSNIIDELNTYIEIKTKLYE